MNGAASGLIKAFKEAYSEGSAWDQIPHGADSWFKYGSGGISCWGTLCGIPNGCIIILNMINLWSALASQVLGHYSETMFPTGEICDLWDGAGPEPIPNDEVVKTVAYSPLCHVSISRWCHAAGVNLTDMSDYGIKHKQDRCGKICAHMARYTAELINYYVVNSAIEDPYERPMETDICIGCHWSNTDASQSPAQCGQMDCDMCHNDRIYHQFITKLMIDDVWTSPWDDPTNAKNDFTADEEIQYNVRFAVVGPGPCYLKTTSMAKAKGPTSSSVWKTPLPLSGDYMGGVYDYSWKKYVPSDAVPGRAKVVMAMKLFDYQGGPKIMDLEQRYKFNIVSP